MATEQSLSIRHAVASALEAWRPPPRLLVSEWAERYRHLSSEASAETGLWSNARAPHLVKPMDCLSPYHVAERVVCKFSSQSGKTEVLLNFIGYCAHLNPGPILCVQPNVKPMGETFSKDRISPMFRDSPALDELVGPNRSRTSAQTITKKHFKGGHLTVAGASSAAALSMLPIQYLCCDELDRWEPTKEGDPLLLARKRLQTFRARRSSKELVVSSPTFPDIGISVEYEKCSQQWEWHLRCLDCGEYQFPRIECFTWDSDDSKTVRYVCKKCGTAHPLKKADKIKSTGTWVCVKDGEQDSIGFWFNQWASPFARWDDTLQEWLDAGDDQMQKQAVKNTAFAETWEGEGEYMDPKTLQNREEAYDCEVPDGVSAITIGVDIQGDRMELETVGWGEGETSWSLDYELIEGAPTDLRIWTELLEYISRTWKHANGVQMLPCAVCIDSGNWSKDVYAFVASQKDKRIIPVKGSSEFAADTIRGDEIKRRRDARKRMSDGRPAEIIGVSQIKRIVMHRLSLAEEDRGYCHFPKGRGLDYYQQLTGERLITERRRGKRPQYVWQKFHNAVEALDCRVYAYAGLLLTKPNLKRKPVIPTKKNKTDHDALGPKNPEKQRARRRIIIR